MVACYPWRPVLQYRVCMYRKSMLHASRVHSYAIAIPVPVLGVAATRVCVHTCTQCTGSCYCQYFQYRYCTRGVWRLARTFRGFQVFKFGLVDFVIFGQLTSLLGCCVQAIAMAQQLRAIHLKIRYGVTMAGLVSRAKCRNGTLPYF